MTNGVKQLTRTRARLFSLRSFETVATSLRWGPIVVFLLFPALTLPQGARGAEAGWKAGPEGILYRNDRVLDVPWSIHIVKIDRARSDFKFTTTLAQGRFIGLAPLTSHVESLPPEIGRPLVAVNGDFYRTERESFAGDPRGLQIAQGELVSAATGGACFWIDAAGNPQMAEVSSKLQLIWPNGSTTPLGLNEERSWRAATLYTARIGSTTRAQGGRELVLSRNGTNSWLPLQPGQLYSGVVREVRDGGNTRLTRDVLIVSLSQDIASKSATVKPGDVVRISTATLPDLTGAQVAIGGGPVLIRRGKVQPVHTNKASESHPRSAFGWSKTHFFFVTVDGRQPGLSIGMTLPELAFYLAKLGCEEAMNLDGGASAELWVAGRIVNSPCFGNERNIGNALALVQQKSEKK